MADKWDDPEYTGFKKYFNSTTIRGRSNWAKLCLGFYAVCYITYKTIRLLTRKEPLLEGGQTQSVGEPNPFGNQTFIPPEGPFSPPCTDPNQQYTSACPYTGTPIAPNFIIPQPQQPGMGAPNITPHPQQPFYPPPPGYYPYYPPPPPNLPPTQPSVPNEQQGQVQPNYPPSYSYPPPPYYPPPAHYPYPYQIPHECPKYAQPNSEYASPDCQKRDEETPKK